MDEKPGLSLAAVVSLIVVLMGLMLAGSFLEHHPTARSGCIGLAGLIIAAFYCRLAIQWFNGRRNRRPPNDP